MKAVKGGERHIYAHVDTLSGKIQDQSNKKLEKLRKGSDDQPIVLENTKMKKIPLGVKSKHEVKTSATLQKKFVCHDKKYQMKVGNAQPYLLPESAAEVYGAPEIHSTLRVGEALIKAQEKKPNMLQLVKSKLDSPNTASKFKKQMTKQVNVPESRAVFQELVSVDVSEEALATQMKDLLTLRAAAVQPPSRPLDPRPQFSDIFDPEEYIQTAACVTTTKVHPCFSSVRPQSVQRKELFPLYDELLGTD